MHLLPIPTACRFHLIPWPSHIHTWHGMCLLTGNQRYMIHSVVPVGSLAIGPHGDTDTKVALDPPPGNLEGGLLTQGSRSF